MSSELHVESGDDRPGTAPGTDPQGRERPPVSGDLPALLRSGPMFRRTLAGYDRFQVDTYVQWAEDELVTADREREHLLAGHLHTRAELDEARELLAHSAGGGEFLQLSRRIGSLLAAAADEADAMRAAGEAELSAAAAEAAGTAAQAEDLLAGARTEAKRLVTEATARAQELALEADRRIADADRIGQDARAEAAERLEAAHRGEEQAAAMAAQLRLAALADADAARSRARQDVIALLATGREQRLRADAEATATRERLDRDAAARRAVLLAEVAELEHRREVLRADLEPAAAAPAPPSANRQEGVRAVAERIHERLAGHAPARRSGTGAAAAVSGDRRRTAA
jgi:hypothetical protein